MGLHGGNRKMQGRGMDNTPTPSAVETEPELEAFELGVVPRPISDRILVRRDEAVDKTAGGILLPESAKTKPRRGLCIAAGPGRILDDGMRAPMEVQEGDRVRFSSYAGTDLNGTEKECGFVIMRVDDVLCVDGEEIDDAV